MFFDRERKMQKQSLRERWSSAHLVGLFVLAMTFILIGCGGDPSQEATDATPCNSKASALLEGNTGVYGTIRFDYQDPSNYELVDGVTVKIYIGGSYHGSTTASACGYYSYDTGGSWGSVHVVVDGSQNRPIRPSNCGSISFYDYAAGDNTVYLWYGFWTQIDINTL